jgi:2'-hydroxyisoflavone reductase
MNRRQWLLSAAALALHGAHAQPNPAGGPWQSATIRKRILILGGTGFIGPHFVREALDRGAGITLFNRGKTRSEPTPGVETLLGDRDGKLDALKGRDWDVVIDNSGYVPRQVQLSTQLLRGHVGQYVYISTVAVYADLSGAGIVETAPLKLLADPATEDVTAASYGGLKALCEKPVAVDFPNRHTIVRPTFIVGPGDDSDRFTYWPWRMAHGGEMLAPGTPLDPIQYIDVRDLARFVISTAMNERTGVFNACTPPGFATIGDLLETSRRVSRAKTEVRWVDEEFLRREGVLDGPELPIWRPPSGRTAGAALVSSARAVQAGLRFLPLEQTIRETLEWQRQRPTERQKKLAAGLDPQREAALLEKWRAGHATG